MKALGALVASCGLLIPAQFTRAADHGGIGVLGDSYSDEYQFYAPHRSISRSWVEILAETRGLNFGPFQAESRGEPRNQGYAFNWARSGATTTSLLALGQHSGLAAQVASGEVRTVVVFIGGNDFIEALNSGSPDQEIEQLADRTVQHIKVATEAVLAASPEVKILAITIPDLEELPDIAAKIRSGTISKSTAEHSTRELAKVNVAIRMMAKSERRLAVLDLARIHRAANLLFPTQLIIANQKVLRFEIGDGLDRLFLGDSRHLGTLGQGLLAKMIVDALNSKFALGIPPLREDDLIRIARDLDRKRLDSATPLASER